MEFQTFFTPENMDVFWKNFKWVLFFVAPGVMLWVALDGVDKLVQVIKKAFSQDDDDDDGYDVHHY